MHALGATATPRPPSYRGRRSSSASAPSCSSSTQYSVLGTSTSTSRWRPTRYLTSRGPLELVRVAAPGDCGPGCYVLKTAKSNSDISRAHLRREALVANQISHASLIPVLAAECDALLPRLILPYLEGISLRRLLNSSQQLPVSYSLCIIRQIAAALGAMHAAGWLHGQVRPEHVIVSPQGHVTLIDLTQARRLESAECDTIGPLPTSPAYAAPEAAFARGRLSAASDAYSLGIVLFESLTGRLPFQASLPRELMQAHVNAAPPDLRKLRTNVSLDAAGLCHSLLAKEPLRRPAISLVVRWLAELEVEELAN